MSVCPSVRPHATTPQIPKKATIRFLMSVCPSIRMQQLDFHRKDFHEILYLIFFF